MGQRSRPGGTAPGDKLRDRYGTGAQCERQTSNLPHARLVSTASIDSLSSTGGIEQQSIHEYSRSDYVQTESGSDDGRRVLGFRLTGYRLLTLSLLLGFSTAKAVQSFKNMSVSASSLDFAFGGGITSVIRILGYVQEDQKRRWPGFFVVDYWSLTLNAVQDMQFRDRILLKVTNIVTYTLFLSSNVYVVANPERIYKESYFTPASWVHDIWYPIHLLLVGYIVYQFFPSGKQIIIIDIGWQFPLLTALTSVYFFLWIRQYSAAAFVFSLTMSGVGTYIHYLVKRYGSGDLTADIFVQIPISLYHSFTNVLTLLNAFQAFGVNAHTTPAGAWTNSLVFIALLYLFLASVFHNISSNKSDTTASIAITWSLFAIFARQTHSPLTSWSALVFAILSLFWIVKGLFGYWKMRCAVATVPDEERGPSSLIPMTLVERGQASSRLDTADTDGFH